LSLTFIQACFHEGLVDKFGGGNSDNVDPEIFSPDLEMTGSLDGLLAKSEVKLTNSEDLSAFVGKLIPRLISHLNVYNAEADLFGSSGLGSGVIKPVFKTGTRVYRIQEASVCEDVDATDTVIKGEDVDIKNLQNKRSLFWDDADSDNVLSEGDRWIRLISQCKDSATQKFSTGTIYYTNIYNQVEALEGNIDKDMTNLGVKLRMQIDFDEGVSSSSIIYEDFQGIYNRDQQSGSYFSIQADSRSSSKTSSDQYVLDYDAASVLFVESEDSADRETIAFTGRYFDNELDGFVEVQNISIDLDYAYGDILNLVILLGGENENISATLINDTIDLRIGEDSEILPIDEVFGRDYLTVISMD
jgi:hypothetical protein